MLNLIRTYYKLRWLYVASGYTSFSAVKEVVYRPWNNQCSMYFRISILELLEIEANKRGQ